MEITRVGDFSLGWGESLVWDERRARLYFVDCAAQTLHWLDDGEVEPHTMQLPSMAAGIVPTDSGALIGALDDGLHLIDVDAATSELLTAYPDAIGGRCNDACADLSGNVITGKLNLGPAAGSAWQCSRSREWRLLDDDIANTNGPTVAVLDDAMTLIIGDTAASYYSYAYDADAATVGPRSVFGDMAGLEGRPDGATLDADGGLWCALVEGGQLARFTTKGLDRTVALPVRTPTDVTFGGAQLDRLYVTSIGITAPDTLEGALLVIDDLGVCGRVEPRCALDG